MSTEKYSLAAGLKWAGAFLIALHMKTPAPLEVLAVLLLIDWLTGLAAAFQRGEVSSETGRKGARIKLMTLLLLWLLYIAEAYARHMTADANLPAWMNFPAADTIATGYIVNEVISVVENFARAGVPIPSQVVEALSSVKKFRIHSATKEQIDDLSR